MSGGQQNSRGGNPGSTGPQGDAGSAKPADLNALREDVAEVADVAIERGRSFVSSAKEQAVGFVDRRKGDAAQSVTDLADALRQSGKSFEDRPNIRGFFDTAADGLEQLAGTVRDRSFSEFYGDAERLLRRRPGTAAAATFLGGFLLSRFIKASAETVRAEAAGQRRAPQAARRLPAQGRA